MSDLSELLRSAGLERRDMTELELAELERVSVRTVQGWRRSGKGPRYRKVGKLVRYPMDWWREWREETGSGSTAGGLGRVG